MNKSCEQWEGINQSLGVKLVNVHLVFPVGRMFEKQEFIQLLFISLPNWLENLMHSHRSAENVHNIWRKHFMPHLIELRKCRTELQMCLSSFFKTEMHFSLHTNMVPGDYSVLFHMWCFQSITFKIQYICSAETLPVWNRAFLVLSQLNNELKSYTFEIAALSPRGQWCNTRRAAVSRKIHSAS